MDANHEQQFSNDSQGDVIEQEPLAVISVDKKKKDKKKYSKSKRDIQEFEVAVTKANLRIAKAVHRGLQVWEKERDASAEKKRDGALRDAIKNGSKSMRKSLQIAAVVPSQLLDATVELIPVKNLWKLL